MSRPFALVCGGLLAAFAAFGDALPEEPSGTPEAAGPAPVEAPPPAREQGAPGSAEKKRFGISLDRTQRLEIRSDEFEAVRNEEGKRFTFRKNVKVTQADVSIRADRLEAYYPPEAKDPEQLVATGSVVVTQGDREAHCERATYHRARAILVCTGGAELRDGNDRVRGEVIEFDLAEETVTVTGGAELELHPRPEDLEDEPKEVPTG